MTSTVFVTGSTAGIGLTTAEMIAEAGHRVIVHARDPERAEQVRSMLEAPVVVGDLASLAETRTVAEAVRSVAEAVRSVGAIDAVVHNAGVYESGARTETVDGLERTFQVNVLAPYLLTALIPVPRRLIYLTSGMASEGDIVLDDLQRERRPWSATGAYRDSKLCEIALAQRWRDGSPKASLPLCAPGG